MQLYQAERDPTKNHDDNHGFEPGWVWRNTLSGNLFLCVGNERNAAEWQQFFGHAAGPLHQVAVSGLYRHLEDRPALGSAAYRNVGKSKGTVAASDDARIKGALQKDRNLSDLKSIDKAFEALGISRSIQRVIQSKTIAEFVENLGLSDVLTRGEAGRMFQGHRTSLDALAELNPTNVGTTIFEAKGADVVLELLGVRPGVEVQRFHKTLTDLQTASADAVRILTAANGVAILSLLGVDDLVRDLRAEIDALRTRVKQLETDK